MWVRRQGQQAAFTIVELIVAIGIIVVLAAVSIVGYGAWRTSIQQTQVKAELTAAASAMETARNMSSGYPSVLPSSYSPNKDVTVTIFSVTTSKFCINGVANQNDTVKFYVDSANQSGVPVAGDCSMSSATTLPNSPTLNTVVVATSTSLSIAWLAVPGTLTGYSVQCATDPAFIVNVKSASASNSSTSTTISGISEATDYYCRVRAESAIGHGAWSDILSAATFQMAVPTGLAVAVNSSSQVTASWSTVTTPVAATSYNMRYSVSSDMSAPTTITGITSTSQVVTGLTPGTTYYFQVRSLATDSQSIWSGSVSATPIVPAPTCSATPTLVSNTAITVNWGAVSGATSYTVERSNSSTFTTPTTQSGVTTTSYTFTGLSNGTTYYFHVKALIGSAESVWTTCPSRATGYDAPAAPTVNVWQSNGDWCCGGGNTGFFSDSNYGGWISGVLFRATCLAGSSLVGTFSSDYRGSNPSSPGWTLDGESWYSQASPGGLANDTLYVIARTNDDVSSSYLAIWGYIRCTGPGGSSGWVNLGMIAID